MLRWDPYLLGEMVRDLVVDRLEQLNAFGEDKRASMLISVQSFLHVFERDILETEDARGVVVCDEHAIHVTYPSLEALHIHDSVDEHSTRE